uniref:Costars domain-containing protein n=1 Tax=Gossypium raimondii TaxID=29730 RepID=A0A0D2TVW2_GOSRA|nr:hypothetical protein B456_013G055100 [Gossypium raimondii]
MTIKMKKNLDILKHIFAYIIVVFVIVFPRKHNECRRGGGETQGRNPKTRPDPIRWFLQVGTLRAAKKRKVVAYDGELLLQGVHDNVEIILKATTPAAAQSSN